MTFLDIDPGEDDDDGDGSCLRSYAPSSIGSPAPKCRALDDDDCDTLGRLDALDGRDDLQPICVYDPEWFDLPNDICPRILVSLAWSAPQTTALSIAIAESIPSHAFAPSSNGSQKHDDHRGDDCAHLLHVPPRTQTSGGRITASYTFDKRWACRKRLSKKVRDALSASRRLERSRRNTLRRMWACFPEADPLPFVFDGGEDLKSRVVVDAPHTSHQSEHLDGQDQQGSLATRATTKVVPSHHGKNDATTTMMLSPDHHTHSAILANIDPLHGTLWLCKAIFASIHRSHFKQQMEGGLHDKHPFDDLVPVNEPQTQPA